RRHSRPRRLDALRPRGQAIVTHGRSQRRPDGYLLFELNLPTVVVWTRSAGRLASELAVSACVAARVYERKVEDMATAKATTTARFRRARGLGAALGAVLVGIAAVAVLTAPLARAAATVQRLGYCGGDDWEPAMAADASHVYVLITHFAGNTSCDPASGQNNSRIMIQVSSDAGKTFSAPAVVAATPGGVSYPSQ